MLKKCRNCEFVRAYFAVVLIETITAKLASPIATALNTAVLVGIPVFAYKMSLEKLGFKNLPAGVIWGAGASLVVLPLYAKINMLLLHRQIHPINSPEVILFFLINVAIPEELFFRGFMYSFIGTDRIVWVLSRANIVSAFLFSLAHVLVHYDATMIKTFLPALLFGYLYEISGSIAAPIIFHWLSDCVYISLQSP